MSATRLLRCLLFDLLCRIACWLVAQYWVSTSDNFKWIDIKVKAYFVPSSKTQGQIVRTRKKSKRVGEDWRKKGREGKQLLFFVEFFPTFSDFLLVPTICPWVSKDDFVRFLVSYRPLRLQFLRLKYREESGNGEMMMCSYSIYAVLFPLLYVVG